MGDRGWSIETDVGLSSRPRRRIGLIRWCGLAALLLAANPPAAAQTPSPRYENVDRYVDAIPSSARRSVATLASYLAGAGRDDTDRARAIFRWLTMNIGYDVEGQRSGNPGDLGPEAVLARGRSICNGYAGLAEALGTAMGMEIEVVNGWSKGYGYTAGETFEGRTNHAWNAVRIDGEWRLMDATWGAGHMDATRGWVRDPQDFYFLTDPTEFIFDHLPEDPEWQLLDPPLSKDDFAALVYLRPDFFSNGLAVESHRNASLRARDHLTVVLQAPESVALLARLLAAGDERPLPDTRTFVQVADGEARITAAFSEPGDYILRIFAKPKSAEGSYGWALDYRVRAEGGAEAADFPLAYSSFHESGSVLLAPMKRMLEAGREHEFLLRVPGASDVSVRCKGVWSPLAAVGDVFEGRVRVCSGEVRVYARFPGKNSFTGLLSYQAR